MWMGIFAMVVSACALFMCTENSPMGQAIHAIEEELKNS